MKIPFVFWEFRDLDPLVNAVGRGIFVGRFLRCLLSSGGVKGSSKELKDNHGWKIQIYAFILEQRVEVTHHATISIAYVFLIWLPQTLRSHGPNLTVAAFQTCPRRFRRHSTLGDLSFATLSADNELRSIIWYYGMGQSTYPT